jgi:hypothetical protein
MELVQANAFNTTVYFMSTIVLNVPLFPSHLIFLYRNTFFAGSKQRCRDLYLEDGELFVDR